MKRTSSLICSISLLAARCSSFGLDRAAKALARRQYPIRHHPQRCSLLTPGGSATLSLGVRPEGDNEIVRGNPGTVDDDGGRWAPLSPMAKVLLPLQIALSIYLLLLLPSGLASGSWWGARAMGRLPYEYMFFFSALLLPRAYRFGKFSKPVTETGGGGAKRGTSIYELLLFILSLAGGHWVAAFRYTRRFADVANVHGGKIQQNTATASLRAIRLLALGLVASSGAHLGKSYDRVARPDALVRTGPYTVVRHPIYTSYLLLFGSALLSLRAYGPCAVLLGAASLFYSHRMDAEEELLADAFGPDWERYRKEVPWRLIPYLY